MKKLILLLALVAAPAFAAPHTVVTKDYLIGKWGLVDGATDKVDCGNAILYNKDGTFYDAFEETGTYKVDPKPIMHDGFEVVRYVSVLDGERYVAYAAWTGRDAYVEFRDKGPSQTWRRCPAE